MTTILFDARLGIAAADSYGTDGDRTWTDVRKVWRICGCLIGLAGPTDEGVAFKNWLKAGCPDKWPCFRNSAALVLSPAGLVHFDGSCIPQPVASGIESIGTGAKVALAAYDSMGFKNPGRAVRMACKYSEGSGGRVRMYKL